MSGDAHRGPQHLRHVPRGGLRQVDGRARRAGPARPHGPAGRRVPRRSPARRTCATTCSSCCSHHDGVDLDLRRVRRGDVRRRCTTTRRPRSRRSSTRFNAVERQCDAVVVVGTDYTDVGGPDRAGLQRPHRREPRRARACSVDQRRRSRKPGRRRAASPTSCQSPSSRAEPRAGGVAVVANRVRPRDSTSSGDRGDALAGRHRAAGLGDPRGPAALGADRPRLMPTRCDGDAHRGRRDACSTARRSASSSAAMSVEQRAARLTDGAVVVTPGDRSDVLLGLLLAHQRRHLPVARRHHPQRRLPAPSRHRAADRRARQQACRSSRTDARHVPDRRARSCRHPRPPDGRLAAQDRHGASPCSSSTSTGRAAGRASTSRGPRCVTPLMFEYQLMERARADRKHIVLPEGEDDRILRGRRRSCCGAASPT